MLVVVGWSWRGVGGLYQEHVSASTNQGAKVRRLSCPGARHHFIGFLKSVNLKGGWRQTTCSHWKKTKALSL